MSLLLSERRLRLAHFLLLLLVALVAARTRSTDSMLSIINIESVNQLEILNEINLDIANTDEVYGLYSEIIWVEANHSLLVYTGNSNRVDLIELSSGSRNELCISETTIKDISVFNNMIYCLDSNNNIRVFDIENNSQLYQIQFDEEFYVVTGMEIAVENELLLVNYFRNPQSNLYNGIAIVDFDLSQIILELPTNTNFTSRLTLSPNEELLVLHTSQQIGNSPSFWQVNLSSSVLGLESLELERNDVYASSAIFSQDGNLLIVDGSSIEYENDSTRPTAFLYDTTSQPELTHTFTGDDITPYGFTLDNRLLIVSTGPRDEQIAFIDLSEKGNYIYEVSRFNFHYENIANITLSPDGYLLATLHEDGNLIIWGVPCEQDCE